MAYPLKLATKQNIENQGQDVKFFVEMDWLKNEWTYVLDSYDSWIQFRELLVFLEGTADEGTTQSVKVVYPAALEVNAYAGKYLYIETGNIAGQTIRIDSNTSDTVYFSGSLRAAPADGSIIKIIDIIGINNELGEAAIGADVEGAYGVTEVYGNLGNGQVQNVTFSRIGQDDLWTLVCIGREDVEGTSRARFLVKGQVNGLQGDAYSGVAYYNDFLGFLIDEGTRFFQEGDIIKIRSALVSRNLLGTSVFSGTSKTSAPLIDGGPDFLTWDYISWEGQNVSVYVRTSIDQRRGLWTKWQEASSGVSFRGEQAGRYLQVKIDLGSGSPQAKIYNLQVAYKVKAHTNYTGHEQYVEGFNRVKNIRVSRNKSEDLQGYSAADFNITWDNSSRDFSRENISSPYYGLLEPNLGVNIKTGFEEELIPRLSGYTDGFSLNATNQAVTTRGKDKVKKLIKHTIKYGNASYRAWSGQTLKFLFKILALDAGFDVNDLDLFDLVVNPIISFVDFRDKSVWQAMQDLATGALADIYVTEEGKLKLQNQFSSKFQIPAPSFFENGADYIDITVNDFYKQLAFIVKDPQASILYSFLNSQVFAVVKGAQGAVYVGEDDFEEGRERHNIWFTTDTILYRLLGSEFTTEFEEIINVTQSPNNTIFTNLMVYNPMHSLQMNGPTLLNEQYGRSVYMVVEESNIFRLVKLNNDDVRSITDTVIGSDLDHRIEAHVDPYVEAPELAKNGEFFGDSQWTLGPYWWVNDDDEAEFNTFGYVSGTGSLEHTVAMGLSTLKTYIVKFDLLEITDHVSLEVDLYGDIKTYDVASNGLSIEEEFTPTGVGNDSIKFTAVDNWVAGSEKIRIDNVSVTEKGWVNTETTPVMFPNAKYSLGRIAKSRNLFNVYYVNGTTGVETLIPYDNTFSPSEFFFIPTGKSPAFYNYNSIDYRVPHPDNGFASGYVRSPSSWRFIDEDVRDSIVINFNLLKDDPNGFYILRYTTAMPLVQVGSDADLSYKNDPRFYRMLFKSGQEGVFLGLDNVDTGFDGVVLDGAVVVSSGGAKGFVRVLDLPEETLYNFNKILVQVTEGEFKAQESVTISDKSADIRFVIEKDLSNDRILNSLITVYQDKDSDFNGYLFYADVIVSEWGQASIVVKSNHPDFASEAPPSGRAGVAQGYFSVPNSSMFVTNPGVTVGTKKAFTEIHKVVAVEAMPCNGIVVVVCECFKVLSNFNDIYTYHPTEYVYKLYWFKVDDPYGTNTDLSNNSDEDGSGNTIFGEEVLDLGDPRVRIYDVKYNPKFQYIVLCGGYDDTLSEPAVHYKWSLTNVYVEFSNLAGKPLADAYPKDYSSLTDVVEKDYYYYFRKMGGFKATTSEIWVWTDFNKGADDRDRCAVKQEVLELGTGDGAQKVFEIPIAQRPFDVKYAYIDDEDVGDNYTFDGTQVVFDNAPEIGTTVTVGAAKRLYRHYGVFLSYEMSANIGGSPPWSSLTIVNNSYKACRLRVTINDECKAGSVTLNGYGPKDNAISEVVVFSDIGSHLDVDENGDRYVETSAEFKTFNQINPSDAQDVYNGSSSRIRIESVYFDVIPGVYLDIYTSTSVVEDQFGGNGVVMGYVDKALISVKREGGLVRLPKISSEKRFSTMDIDRATGAVFLGTENRGYGAKYAINEEVPLSVYSLDYDRNLIDLSYDWNDNSIKNAIIVKTKKMQTVDHRDIDRDTGIDVSGDVPSLEFLDGGNRTYEDWQWARLETVWKNESPQYLYKGGSLEYLINFEDPVDNDDQTNLIKFNAQYVESLGYLDENGEFTGIEADFPDHVISSTQFGLHAGYGELHAIRQSLNDLSSHYYRIFAPWDEDSQYFVAQYPSRLNNDFAVPDLGEEVVVNGDFSSVIERWSFNTDWVVGEGGIRHVGTTAPSGVSPLSQSVDFGAGGSFLLTLTFDSVSNYGFEIYVKDSNAIEPDLLIASISTSISNYTNQVSIVSGYDTLEIIALAGSTDSAEGILVDISIKQIESGSFGIASLIDLSYGVDLSTGSLVELDIDGEGSKIVDCAALAADITKVTADEIVQAINMTIGKNVAKVMTSYHTGKPHVYVQLKSAADLRLDPVGTVSSIGITFDSAAIKIFGIFEAGVYTVNKTEFSIGLLEKKAILVYAGSIAIPLTYEAGDFDIVAYDEGTSSERWVLVFSEETRERVAGLKLTLLYPDRVNAIRSDIDKTYRGEEGSAYKLEYGAEGSEVIRKLRSYGPQGDLYTPAMDVEDSFYPSTEFEKGLSGFHLNMLWPNESTLLGSSLLRIENPTDDITDSLFNSNEDPSNLSVWINKIEIRGLPIVSSDLNLISVRDEKSIKEYGKIEDTFTNDYIQDSESATKIANFLLKLKAFPVIKPSIKILGLPFLQLGDVVGVKEINSALAYDLFELIEMSEDLGVNSPYTMSISIFKVLDRLAGSAIGHGEKYNTGIAYKNTILSLDFKEEF